jgi:hypothetical protein
MGRISPEGPWRASGVRCAAALLFATEAQGRAHQDETREILYENTRLQMASEGKPHLERAVDGDFRCAASPDDRVIPLGFRWSISCACPRGHCRLAACPGDRVLRIRSRIPGLIYYFVQSAHHVRRAMRSFVTSASGSRSSPDPVNARCSPPLPPPHGPAPHRPQPGAGSAQLPHTAALAPVAATHIAAVPSTPAAIYPPPPPTAARPTGVRPATDG